MTLSSNPALVQYVGDGSNASFGIAFDIEAAADIDVTLTTTAGVTALQVLNSDYSVSGSNVIFVTAPASGMLVTVARAMDYEQQDTFPGDEIPQKAFELALDRIAMQVQQLRAVADRCLQLPVGTRVTFDAEMPTPIGNGELFLRLKSNELGFEFAQGGSGGGGEADGVGIVSVEGVSNEGGNIDLIGVGCTITGDNTAKTITFTVTAIGSVTSVNGTAGDVTLVAGTAMNITGLTINFDPSGVANDAISGNKIDGGIISHFASTGINDGATGEVLTLTDTRLRVRTVSGIRIESTAPVFDLYDTNAGVDEKFARWAFVGGQYVFQQLTDAYSSPVAVWAITRVGTACTAVDVTTTLMSVIGNLAASGTLAAGGNVTFSGTGATKLQSGNTAARPSPSNGMIRYNSQTNKFEAYENGGWANMINTSAGEINTASNVGGGAANVFKTKSTYDLEFKTFVAGSNITLTDGTDTITIAASGTSGEINTASNVTGTTGVGIFKQKSSLDLQFKSLLAGAGITITGGTSDVTIASTAYTYNVKDPTYGATGDGSTDDVAAIEAAITAALLTGGRVYFPRGIYAISRALAPLLYTFSGGPGDLWQNVKRVSISGDGPASQIKYTGGTPVAGGATTTPFFTTTNGSPTITVTCSGILAAGLSVQDTVTWPTAVTGNGITLLGDYQVVSVSTNSFTITASGNANASSSFGSAVAFTNARNLLNLTNNVTGGDSGRDIDYGYVRDITITASTPQQAGVVGLRMRRRGAFLVDNVLAYALGTGFQLHSSLTGTFRNCKAVSNLYGWLADNHVTGFSSCNAVAFENCLAANNQLGGVRFTNGSYSWGGNVEGNGGAGGSSAFGLRYIRDANQLGADSTGFSISEDCYFESNGSAAIGKATVWITLSNTDVTESIAVSIRNSNFNRLGGALGNHCTNEVLIEHNSLGVLQWDIDSNGFQDFGFTPALSQKYIDITTTTSAGRTAGPCTNHYGSANAVPDLATISGAPFQPTYIPYLVAKRFTLPRQGVKLYRTSSQTANNTTPTPLTWQQALYDDGLAVFGQALWNGSDGVIVPPGVTQARGAGQIRWNAVAGGSRTATVKINNGGFPCQPQNQVAAVGFTSNNLAFDWINVTPGQVISLVGVQDSGAGIDMLGGANSTTWFGVEFR